MKQASVLTSHLCSMHQCIPIDHNANYHRRWSHFTTSHCYHTPHVHNGTQHTHTHVLVCTALGQFTASVVTIDTSIAYWLCRANLSPHIDTIVRLPSDGQLANCEPGRKVPKTNRLQMMARENNAFQTRAPQTRQSDTALQTQRDWLAPIHANGHYCAAAAEISGTKTNTSMMIAPLNSESTVQWALY